MEVAYVKELSYGRQKRIGSKKKLKHLKINDYQLEGIPSLDPNEI